MGHVKPIGVHLGPLALLPIGVIFQTHRGGGVDARGGEDVTKQKLLKVAIAVALVGGGIAGGLAATSDTTPKSQLVMKACSEDLQQARCGTLMVPEDRLTGAGRRIPVRVVVFPGAAENHAFDPIVYVAGGPGSSAVEVMAQQLPLFSENTTRDVVFIEQRGTGDSNVVCPSFPGPSIADKSALRARVESCLKHLRADPRFYTTALYTDDVSEVLSDLRYSKVDLVGGSYGASTAQVFLLRHPGQVRTMTLLSGSLLSVPLFEHMPATSEEALDRVFAECSAEPACRLAFPNPAGDWAKVLASIRRSP